MPTDFAKASIPSALDLNASAFLFLIRVLNISSIPFVRLPSRSSTAFRGFFSKLRKSNIFFMVTTTPTPNATVKISPNPTFVDIHSLRLESILFTLSENDENAVFVLSKFVSVDVFNVSIDFPKLETALFIVSIPFASFGPAKASAMLTFFIFVFPLITPEINSLNLSNSSPIFPPRLANHVPASLVKLAHALFRLFTIF